jgi:hypothetical protein
MRHWTAGVPLLTLLFFVGCAGWNVIPLTGLQRLDEHVEVQVWQRGLPAVFHAVRLNGDTLSGIPYDLPTRCSSCRLSFTLATVDSIRLRRGPADRHLYVMVAFPVVLAVLLSFGLGPGGR